MLFHLGPRDEIVNDQCSLSPKDAYISRVSFDCPNELKESSRLSRIGFLVY
jgi:hypothetical protein